MAAPEDQEAALIRESPNPLPVSIVLLSHSCLTAHGMLSPPGEWLHLHAALLLLLLALGNHTHPVGHTGMDASGQGGTWELREEAECASGAEGSPCQPPPHAFLQT